MKSTRRPRLARTLTAALVAGSLALAGCSNDTGDAPAEPNGESTEPVATGGTLTVASPYAIESLDPHGTMGQNSGTKTASQAIFSRVVATNEDGDIVPDLATEWAPNEDSSEWTFTIREANFSDGSELTAKDVVASYERAVDIGGPVASNYSDLTFSAPDDRTFVVTSPGPDAAIPAKLSLMYVAPEGQDEAAYNTQPVGSGPFKVETFSPGENLTLVPNENYFGDAVALDTLVVRSIPEISARVAALQAGEIQATWGVPDDQLATIEGSPNLVTELVPATSVVTMWFNSGRDAFKDAEVRQAFWQAVDFETIISTLFPSTGSPADAPIASNIFGYSPQEPVTYDPDAAKARLESAGFDFSQQLEIQYSGAEYRQFIQAVASDFAKIGLNVVPTEKENAVFTEDLLAMNWDINFQALSTPTYDAATNLGRLYTCAAGRNGFCDPELDELLQKAGSSTDLTERKDAYADASKIIWDNAVGMYPMFLKIAYVWSDNVSGIAPSGSFIPDFSHAKVS